MNINSKKSFSKVSHRKLVDEVLERLQEKIFSGEYAVGDRLPTEPQLMEELGVGRSTLRESIKILVHAGILEVRQGQGTRIVSLNTVQDSFEKRLQGADIDHVYEARNMLDKEVAMLAAKRRNEEDLLLLKGYLNKRKNALHEGSYLEYIDADIQFHLSIAKASKNQVLLDLYESFVPVLRRILTQLILSANNYQDNSVIHEKLFQAILNQNAEEAQTYAIQNLELK
ncbi:GntR family transcriptional regulator [Bacillus thuringiensis]|uniref:GntR family transcriptional regulator n=1 Tax=Bacillus thuringiensis TaxID=1428 RepID=A0ABD6RTS6_BACTU|nr:FadR/GntR family transcriptional regulator [Bacillus thuringiensis]PER38283.1 GntR family transcriptional regulator [Bacillus thuringiensis]PEU72025.1 GntR family transcriptional regulator [Bacillus thuringiensis]PFI04506.1 GntR family transcriptional regulator [Bacillus thuringiensis]PFW27261.1 GntR family transcriptional regulator [Bacillus thuringiensis]PGY67565.1 GntR family transcriptional regulator [Bacillus thuringiensis]